MVSCDDGDVIAYTTRSISNSMSEKDPGEPYGKLSFTDLRPFFLENVMQSAWGLAIHKGGRMIAVSANTHTVTVFAFALRHVESGSSGELSDNESEPTSESDLLFSSDDVNWSPTGGSTSPPDRSVRNIVITLSGHCTNIPNVSFCNSEDDLDGRYLASTDILGCTILWDVWAQTPIMRHAIAGGIPPAVFGSLKTWVEYSKFYTLSFCTNCNSRVGWGALCIGARSFRLTKGDQETFGCKPERKKGCWDISNSRTEIKDSSVWHPSYSQFTSVPGMNTGTQEETFQGSDGEHEESDGAGDSPNESAEHDWLAEAVDWLDEADDEGEADWDLNMEVAADSGFYDLVELGGEPLVIRGQQPSRDGWKPAGADGKTPQKETDQKSSNLTFSILHTSETEISLFQDPLKQANVTMTDPLSQHIPPNIAWLSHFNRMNMLLQIPELGVVIVASQKGRVVLLTMTRLRGTRDRAFRADWILPFKSQEEQGLRPNAPLLGIAAGPIQGRELLNEGADGGSPYGAGKDSWRGVESSRRYRLLLTYFDHTVLSYYIERCASERQGVSVEEELLIF